jgi:hypothetical protein
VAAIDNLEHLVTLCDGSLDGLDSLQASAEEWKLVSELLDGLATGALADAPKIAQAWAKQRDQISLRLRFCRLYARQRMQTYINSTRTENSALMAACWAYLLQNAITAERLIFERNLNANAVLCLLLSTCAEIARLPNLVFVEPHKHLLQEVVV